MFIVRSSIHLHWHHQAQQGQEDQGSQDHPAEERQWEGELMDSCRDISSLLILLSTSTQDRQNRWWPLEEWYAGFGSKLLNSCYFISRSKILGRQGEGGHAYRPPADTSCTYTSKAPTMFKLLPLCPNDFLWAC